MSAISYYYRIYSKFGIKAVLFLLKSKFIKNKTSNIRFSNMKHPVTLSNYGADVTTLFQIFLGEEYKVDMQEAPKVIIDCGANIGLSAVYFANKWPSANIIAFEPDAGNFKYLIQNTRPYKNVTCIQKAIWSHPTKMNIVDQNTGNWGLKTVEATGGESNGVDAIDLNTVMKENSLSKIDLLKIDIEGAEKELFSTNFHHWLSNTKVLAIELHDEDGNDVSSVFEKAISNYPHRKYQLGENVVCDFTVN